LVKRASTAVALCAVVLASPAFSSDLANQSLQCAALSYANWDYEVETYDKVDRSPEWKDQAKAFRSVALRKGVSKRDANKAIARERGPLKDMLRAFLFAETRKQTRAYEKIAARCDKILESEPEMRAYK
jgi:hypothetical protein